MIVPPLVPPGSWDPVTVPPPLSRYEVVGWVKQLESDCAELRTKVESLQEEIKQGWRQYEELWKAVEKLLLRVDHVSHGLATLERRVELIELNARCPPGQGKLTWASSSEPEPGP